jgi:predicted glycosyltransferase
MSPPPTSDPPRIALYSHDAQGLGHIRRNLSVAAALADGGRRDVLVISGTREAGRFATPPGVEILALPAIAKSRAGEYRSRSLGLSLDELLAMRARTIDAALAAFGPEVLIADKHPTGMNGELRPAIERLWLRGGTKFVLGLREVLDDPEVVRAEWQRDGALRAMREWYDAIWVYGDPLVFDTVTEYGFDPGLAAKTRFTGYLGRAAGDPRDVTGLAARIGIGAEPFVLCVVGGGQDGFDLASAFAAAPLPSGLTGVIVAGPFMPRAERRWLTGQAAMRDDLVVCEFVDDPAPLLARGRAVVAMGGYNTICELLHHGRRTLVVPRTRPRREQLIRAERLARTGVLDVLDPEQLTPAALGRWLAEPAPALRPHPAEAVDLDGLAALPGLVRELGVGVTGRFARERVSVAR